MRARRLSAATLAGIVLVLLAALLYFVTLDNGFHYGELDGGDLITHQYAQVQGRPSNAPGYPLYTMGGWLWFHTLRPVLAALAPAPPNPIPILSAYSTVWALLALWLLYTTICFLTCSRYRAASRWGAGGNWPLAWLSGAFYAVTYFFWYYATTTEQYTSAIAQTLAIFYIYLLWSEADAQAGACAYPLQRRPGRLLLLLAFLCGLSLAHMLTVGLIVPPVVVAVLWQRPTLVRMWKVVVAAVGAASLPLLAYLYVYVRGAQHPEWWGSMTFAGARDWFWFFVSTSQGRDELGWGFAPGARFFANGFPNLIWAELSLPIVLLGTAGLALLRRRDAFVACGSLLLYALFAWAYRYGNWFQVILPIYPIILVGAAVLLDRAQAHPRLARSQWLRAIPLVLLASAVLWRAAASLPQADSRGRPEDVALDRAAVLLEGAPEHAALFASVGDALALDYLISIWRLHPDAALVSADKAAGALAQGRPLLATWETLPTLLAEAGLGPEAHVAAYSPDWALIGGGAPQPTPAGTDVSLVDGVTLAGYAVGPAPAGAPVVDAPAHALDVLLWWRLRDGRWPPGVSISVRALAGDDYLRLDGGALSQQDAGAPLRGFLDRATDADLLADAYRLPLPASGPPPTGFEVLLYTADGPVAAHRLPLHQ